MSRSIELSLMVLLVVVLPWAAATPCAARASRAIGSGTASGEPPHLPRVIFSTVADSPTSDVPTTPGAKFTQFFAPSGSPNGRHWILLASFESGGDPYDTVVMGSGTVSSVGNMPVTGGVVGSFDPGSHYVSFRSWMGINDEGKYAFSAVTDAISNDDLVVRWNGGYFELVAREGSQAPQQPPGVGYGANNDAVAILNDSSVTFRSAGLTGAADQQVLYRSYAIDSGSVIAQTDVTVPADQLGSSTETLDFLYEAFRMDASGAHYLYYANLNGSFGSDDIVVYDGAVVAQEGAPLPGSSFSSPVLDLPSSLVAAPALAPANGHYLFRGSNSDGQDWVARNGQVVATSGAPIHPGASETFGYASYPQTFLLNVTNSRGDYLVGGVTNSTVITANTVLVSNSKQVVLRTGNPVDLDGNGLADDGVRIGDFVSDHAFLTDDLHLYFIARLEDDDGQDVGQAYMVVNVGFPTYLPMVMHWSG